MIVINIFGGPGAGKSTNAAGLFSLMKRNYFNCELVQEYAKDLTYDRNWEALKQQNHVLDEQDRRLRRLVGQVDFAITDGALLNSIIYRDKDYHLQPDHFKETVLAYHKKYNNINFYLQRTKKYVPIGRSQTEGEALELDDKVFAMLIEHEEEFTPIIGNNSAPQAMMDHIQGLIAKDVG